MGSTRGSEGYCDRRRRRSSIVEQHRRPRARGNGRKVRAQPCTAAREQAPQPVTAVNVAVTTATAPRAGAPAASRDLPLITSAATSCRRLHVRACAHCGVHTCTRGCLCMRAHTQCATRRAARFTSLASR